MGGDSGSQRVDLSIVIVSWNTAELLRACLESLTLSLDEESGLCEVIVADNGSGDGSLEMVAKEFPRVRLVRNEKNLGFAGGVNSGFREAGGRYVLLLNSDTTVTKRALDDCLQYLDRHDEIGILGCRLLFPDGTVQSSTFRFPSLSGVFLGATWLAQLFPRNAFFNSERYGRKEWSEVTPVDCVMGSVMFIRRGLIEGDTLLDDGYFMYGEETDLCWRIKQMGKRVMFYPHATVVHHHSGSSSSSRRTSAWAYGAKRRGILRFLRIRRGWLCAYLANVIFLVDLLPRALGWGLLDLADLSRRRPGGRLLRLRVAGFHARALLRPSSFLEAWSGPS